MKKIIYFLCVIAGTTSCVQSKKENLTTGSDSTATGAVQNFYVYGQVDSTFKISDKKFHVQVKQYDLTEFAAAKGDTLSRPTYSCSVKISDVNGKVLFADSVLRDSWGYAGKIMSIDAYQVAMPLLQYTGTEILLSFNIFEQVNEDAIRGFIAFDVNTHAARYFWQESGE